jgi:uncharacterized membrane protein YdjX (TVP38/TMEM64 family)
MKRIALLAMIAVLIYGIVYLDLHEFLTLDGIKSGLDEFARWNTAHPLRTGVAFFGFYVLVTALSLPGAAAMTLAAGAVFGLAWGTLIVSFASSIGATLAFLISRYLLRDAVQNRFGERLRVINEGIRKEGAFYLFALRLVPVIPYFLINLLMGLTPIRATVFYCVSQAGMLAGALVYVNAGAQLASLDSLAGIFSPALVFSFTLLGLLPLLAKKILTKVLHSA